MGINLWQPASRISNLFLQKVIKMMMPYLKSTILMNVRMYTAPQKGPDFNVNMYG